MLDVVRKLAEDPVFSNLGVISNPEEFSSLVLKNDFNKHFRLARNIQKNRETDFYDLSSIPTQFHATIQQAILVHEQERSHQTNCQILIDQGNLEIGDNFRVKKIHFDALVDSVNTDYPNNDVFLVSDSLPTQFYLQPFIIPRNEFAPLEGNAVQVSDALSRLFKAQADETRIITPAAYEMARYDSFTVHQAQLAAMATRRTFMMTRFF